ncbi:MAG: NAD-dependent epimerase/dehydratase family protein [Candidatus Omnitrophota bacterium]
MKDQKILMTGAAGKIGGFLVKSLLDKGYGNITLLCVTENEISRLSGLRVGGLRGDLLDVKSYSAALEGVDTVVHMAAVTHTNDKARYFRVNAEATLDLVNACKAKGVRRFIHVSTRAISERGGAYSESKSLAEKHVSESGLDWVIIRPAEVYGISGKEGVDMVLKNIRKFPVIPVLGNGKYKVAPVHIADVVRAITGVIDNPGRKNRIYNIAGPEEFTYNEFIDKVLTLNGVSKIKIHIPVFMFRALAEVLALVFKDRFLAVDQIPRLLSDKSADISLAAHELGFKPARLEDMFNNG